MKPSITEKKKSALVRWEEGEMPNKEEDAELVADNEFSDLLEAKPAQFYLRQAPPYNHYNVRCRNVICSCRTIFPQFGNVAYDTKGVCTFKMELLFPSGILSDPGIPRVKQRLCATCHCRQQ